VKRPWWDMGLSPRAGFLIGGGYFLIGLMGLTMALLGGAKAWVWVMAVLWLVLGSVYLLSTMARRRQATSTARAEQKSP
jgi:hypothetical protein